MNNNLLHKNVDILMFAKNPRDREAAYAEIMGSLYEMRHSFEKRFAEGPTDQQLAKLKPIDGKPKRKPPTKSIPSEIAWERPCPKCGVGPNEACASIGPLNRGKKVKFMHPERCGATTRLNQPESKSGSSGAK